MREKMVVRIEFTTDSLRYTGGIRNCRHSGISNERIYLVLFFTEQVHYLYKSYSADCGNDELH
jgi:hypothetical protein